MSKIMHMLLVFSLICLLSVVGIKILITFSKQLEEENLSKKVIFLENKKLITANISEYNRKLTTLTKPLNSEESLETYTLEVQDLVSKNKIIEVIIIEKRIE